MLSIDLIKIPGGWAAHCKEAHMGAVSSDKLNSFMILKNTLLCRDAKFRKTNSSIFFITRPGHYSFKNISDSAPTNI
jgi:hypothetical protein